VTKSAPIQPWTPVAPLESRDWVDYPSASSLTGVNVVVEQLQAKLERMGIFLAVRNWRKFINQVAYSPLSGSL
jgi:hypothetical protein